ncbi:hypothetical protein A1O1_04666 [Capronia coronata CBS 617.96]|uniref:UBC core domain-containing protein n=1 Tax=Capronia coronata CBS 617.96 TaxID=1182541 RepID=W9YDI0_9EURO|nr:uncharacterized protein A1O1_04666 [Capronia coronata CBS 617.96]EXJ87740.1 hypothetical protein A1O1_04666 [Capronia coronata CBS 617.96]
MAASLLPSFRRQQLVLDFSSLRGRCPSGIYLSLTPGNPSLWAGVLFVRKGPYAQAILRFQISFPDTYPDVPPLVTFSSDIFHPLVVPVTSYAFSAGAGDTSNTLSASETDRLPPGAFSLRYGFPHWSGPGSSSVEGNNVRGVTEQACTPPFPQPDHIHKDRSSIIVKVLHHIQDAFQNETLLDNMPLDAAGNPSAWHAWRAHRGLAKKPIRPNSPAGEGDRVGLSSPKHPGDWKWDGVWESRVNDGIEASVSEGALFGSNNGGRTGNGSIDMRDTEPHQRMLLAADRQIRFSKLDEEQFDAVKDAIAMYGSTVPS